MLRLDTAKVLFAKGKDGVSRPVLGELPPAVRRESPTRAEAVGYDVEDKASAFAAPELWAFRPLMNKGLLCGPLFLL